MFAWTKVLTQGAGPQHQFLSIHYAIFLAENLNILATSRAQGS